MKDLLTKVALRCGPLEHVGVNIEGLLFLETEVIHRHNLLLTNPDSPSHGLVHKSLGPPGTCEDDLVEVLEIEARATRLELDEKHLLLALHQRHVRAIQNILLLSSREAAVILLDEFNSRLRAKHILEHVHLVAKVTEDDPLVRLRRIVGIHPLVALACPAYQALEHIEFGGRAHPVRPGIKTLECGLASANVDLRMQRKLAKSHEEFEFLQRPALAGPIGVQRLPATTDSTRHTLVELALVLRVEIHDNGLLLRRRRRIRNRSAQLIHRARHHILLEDRYQRLQVARLGHLDASNLEQRHEVLDLVHDRRARQ